jgi:hypothetical protein
MPITLDLTETGVPKRQIIELAFGEAGSAGYEFGRTAEEVNDALLRLNAMMAEYPFSTLAYEQPTYGVGNPDEASGIPIQYLNVVASKLALRISPAMGATMSPEAKANLAMAMSQLNAAAASIPTMPMGNNVPRGSGYRSGFGPYINEAYEDVNTGDA